MLIDFTDTGTQSRATYNSHTEPVCGASAPPERTSDNENPPNYYKTLNHPDVYTRPNRSKSNPSNDTPSQSPRYYILSIPR